MSDESIRVLDDLSYEGTLGQRRLQYESSDDPFKKKLFKLTKPIFRFEDLLHIKLTTKFIDSNGKVFDYKKSTYYPLEYHKIVKFVETPNGYAVEVRKFHCRFFLTREPQLDWKYAGIIRVGRGFLLYDFSEIKKPSTRRML